MTRFTAFERSDDTGFFKLIHDTAGTVVTDGELALDERCRALLLGDNEAGGVVEERVAVREVDVGKLAVVFAVGMVFRKEMGGGEAGLFADVVRYLLDFGSVDEGTLYTYHFAAL